MAAKLKKRALAEYQSQVQVEDSSSSSDKSKRLKLSLRNESTSDQESVVAESLLPCLDTEAVTNREVIENILGFSVTNLSGESLVTAVKKISETIKKEKDPCIKSRLLSVWAEILCQDHLDDIGVRMEELLSVTDSSSKVLSSWMAAVKKVVMKHHLGRSLKQKIFTLSSTVLHSSPHPVVHSKVLDLISSLVSPDIPAVSSQALELCGSYSMSQDARVRTSAFHGLLTIHNRGVKLDVSMYNVFCTGI